MRIIRRLPKYEATHRRDQTVQKGAIVLEQLIAGRRIRDESILWLNKYGFYSYRNNRHDEMLIGAGLAMVLGGFIAKYLHEIYHNEQKTIEEYRYIEFEASPVYMYLQKVAVAATFWLESRLFVTKHYNPSTFDDVRTEGILRTLQIRHFKRNKDRRTDFANIGTMEKFPFPRFDHKLKRTSA